MYSLIYVGSFRSHLATKLLYVNSGEAVTDFTASNATLAPVTQNGTEKYVKATSNGTVARTGVFPVGGMFSVVAGERYKIRMKGYRTGTSAANLLIKAGGNDLSWPGTAVPLNAATESWIEQIVTIPAGATTLEAGAVWATVTSGEVLYINEFEIIKLETTTPEYQYNLKDHLGNVRLTFTTKQETESATATMEVSSRNAEKSKFVNYDRVRIVNTSPLFDHTNDGVGTSEGSSIRLSGDANNEKTGLVKTLSVMPGDVVNMEVYAKYLDANQGNWNAFLVGLVGSIHGTTPSGVTDGASYSTNNTYSFPYTGVNGTGSSTGTGPKAYLNFIMFDKDFNPITDITQTNYRRISTAAKETGTNLPNGVAHERLNASVTVKQPGYMYIYLSNEETGRVEVYFDDFKVDHIKSPVLQMDDYYAFGLTFNSFRRENSLYNDFVKFQGQENIDDLGLNWDSFKWRNHQPDIGRFFNVDPLAEKYVYNSPYSFAENKLGLGVELEGRELFPLTMVFKAISLVASSRLDKIQNSSQRLLSGRSGQTSQNAPSEVTNSNKQMVKISSTVKEVNTIVTETNGMVKDATKATAVVAQEVGDLTQKAGIGISVCGLPEVGAPIIAAGSVIENGGIALETAVNLSEGNYEEIIWDSGAMLLDKSVSNVIKNVTDAQEIGEQGRNILEANKEFIEETTKKIADEESKP